MEPLRNAYLDALGIDRWVPTQRACLKSPPFPT